MPTITPMLTSSFFDDLGPHRYCASNKWHIDGRDVSQSIPSISTKVAAPLSDHFQ